jgi:serine/threonine protein kinase
LLSGSYQQLPDVLSEDDILSTLLKGGGGEIREEEYERLKSFWDVKPVLFKAYSKSQSAFPLEKVPIRSKIRFDVLSTEFAEVSKIATGSNSDIFSAVFENENVVVKMLSKEAVNNKVAHDEFQLELDILCRFSHDNIIRVIAAGVDPRPLIVLEPLTGTLANKLNSLMSSKKHLLSCDYEQINFSILTTHSFSLLDFKYNNQDMLRNALSI